MHCVICLCVCVMCACVMERRNNEESSLTRLRACIRKDKVSSNYGGDTNVYRNKLKLRSLELVWHRDK